MMKPIGLHVKIILITTVIISIMSAATAWSLSTINRKIMLEIQFSEFESLVSNLATNVEHALLIGDNDLIRKVLDNKVRSEDTVFTILVHDEQEITSGADELFDQSISDIVRNKMSLMNSSEENQAALHVDHIGKVYLLTAPIVTSRSDFSEVGLFGMDMLETEKIGDVGIVFSTKSLDAKVARANSFIFIIVSSLAALIILFVLVISRRLVAHIQVLTRALEKVSRGDLKTKVDIQTGDEMELLSQGFNNMVEQLEKTTVSRDKLIAEIDERQKAESARAESEINLSNVVDKNIDAILVLDEKKKILLANQAACNFFGTKPDKLVDHFFEHPFKVDETQEIKIELDEKDNFKLGEMSARRTIWSTETAYLVIIRDITERMALENQLRQSQKMEAIGKLAGGVAHDFNNLLSIMGGYAELLLDRLKGDEETAADLMEIKNSVDRASALTRQLLAFSRRQIMNPKVVNINETLDGMESMIRRLIGSDIDLVVSKSEDLKNTVIDPGGLEQVLINLIVNGRDAMDGKGRLIISTTNYVIKPNGTSTSKHALKPGEYVRVAVKDSGTGMSKEIQSRIFEPFFTTKGKDKGTGLGLATSYGIIKESNGLLYVESTEGEGSVFEIILPAVDLAVEEPKSPEDESLPHGTETILFAEDQKPVRDLIVRVLKGLGYKVFPAENGEEAMTVVSNMKDTHIDLLLTDLAMPVMGGVELAEKMTRHQPDVKVLYISGHIEEKISKEHIDINKINHLNKPFTHLQLAKKVREILDH